MSLVSLVVKQPEWQKIDDEVFVGKDVLELLSTSMYVDPLSLYREYVQNSADALDSLPARDLAPSATPDVEILIDRQERSIRILDHGPGLNSADFIQRITSIGGSLKRGTKARGFRGVGRLSGLAFCQELIFRTRERKSSLVHELRWDTRKIRSLLRAAGDHMGLATIVSESIDFRSSKATDEPPHFFEVQLRNVVRHRDDRLLDSTVVSKYLGQVAPVPFHSDFSYAPAISEFLHSSGVRHAPLNILIHAEGQVFRPHRDHVRLGNGKALKATDLQTFSVHDRDGDLAASTWILHHEYLGALPRSTGISGWRLRSGNIQVGGEHLLEDLYPETRFNSWTVGETHVIDKRIIPNGRRDDFEHNAYYADLLTRLRPFAKEIANLCRTSSISRNAHQRVAAELDRLEENLTIATKRRTPAFVVAAFRSELETALPGLHKSAAKPLFDTHEGEALRNRLRRIQDKGEQLRSETIKSDPLGDFAPRDRTLLLQIIEAIHVIEGSSSSADKFVGKLLSRLRRQKTARKQQN